MPEEYYEKKDMERDLGTTVEPYTSKEIDEMYEAMKMKQAIYAYLRTVSIGWKFKWER